VIRYSGKTDHQKKQHKTDGSGRGQSALSDRRSFWLSRSAFLTRGRLPSASSERGREETRRGEWEIGVFGQRLVGPRNDRSISFSRRSPKSGAQEACRIGPTVKPCVELKSEHGAELGVPKEPFSKYVAELAARVHRATGGKKASRCRSISARFGIKQLSLGSPVRLLKQRLSAIHALWSELRRHRPEGASSRRSGGEKKRGPPKLRDGKVRGIHLREVKRICYLLGRSRRRSRIRGVAVSSRTAFGFARLGQRVHPSRSGCEWRARQCARSQRTTQSGAWCEGE